MHIPDGYLSPSTCVALFGAATPFWVTALNNVRRMLNTRMIPLLSVFAAFSFVIMMFNLPLPGGTTGHAVGMGVASIVLGPWASIVAISVALAIQAVFFGDGGITALGANCFNMAIVGSLVAYWTYRVIAQRATIASRRRVLAAGLAGYAGINVAALCAAIEFGVQPALFHDASGAPLYAPYGLHIAIPAMMIGHLTFAGLAELVISTGLIAWLQRVDPGLLRFTAPDAPDRDQPLAPPDDSQAWPAAWRLWLVLGLLMVLTPLGILAVGDAWGEWSARDFADAQARSRIASASRNQLPPAHAPRGLERLSSIWTAPLSRYAPSFIQSQGFGYFVSAMVGVGLIVLLSLVVGWLVRNRAPSVAVPPAFIAGRKRRENFIEKTIRSLFRILQHALFAEKSAQYPGLLQRLDARVKLLGFIALIFAAVAVHRLSILIAMLAASVLLAFLARIPIRMLATKVWIAVLAFTGLIALPAIFLTPGEIVYRLPVLDWPVSYQGLRGAAFLILRAETAATFAGLLVHCTFWSQLLRAMRWFRVPAILVAIVGMTYRYVFLLAQMAEDMFEAREARLVGVLEPEDRRRLAAASAGLLLNKSIQLSAEVHLAMQARGFRGDVHLLDEPTMTPKDWLGLAGFAGLACLVMWLGR